MRDNVMVTKSQYEALLHKTTMEDFGKLVTLGTGVIGMLIIFWQIAIYVNTIKNDVAYLKKKLNIYFKKSNNVDEFLIRKFKDYDTVNEDTLS